jgi:hypothetical protein
MGDYYETIGVEGRGLERFLPFFERSGFLTISPVLPMWCEYQTPASNASTGVECGRLMTVCAPGHFFPPIVVRQRRVNDSPGTRLITSAWGHGWITWQRGQAMGNVCVFGLFRLCSQAYLVTLMLRRLSSSMFVMDMIEVWWPTSVAYRRDERHEVEFIPRTMTL